MRSSLREVYRTDARAILSNARIPVHTTGAPDFHQLRSEQIDALMEQADIRRYQKPKGANGSRARYFYQMLLRRAR